MSEGTYLLVVTKPGKSFKPLKEEFKKLSGFYTGIGYAFPKRNQQFLKELVAGLPNVNIRTFPLAEGQSFEAFEALHTTCRYRDMLIENTREISSFKEQYNLSEFTEESIQAADLTIQEIENAMILLNERDQLKDSIEWAEGMEKTLSKKTESLNIQSISEISPDYFSKEPPEKPTLLTFIDSKGKKTPFMHKEITAMLVAEGGRGKTHLCAQLALCVTSGVPFLGKFEISNPGAVCLIVGEYNPQDIHRLLFKTRHQINEVLKENELLSIERLLYPISVHGIPAALVDEKGNPTPFFYNLLEEVKSKEPEGGFQLIIFDPLSRFSGTESEKDNAIATSFIACVEKMCDGLKGKPTILLSHHKSKAATNQSQGQTDARGASAFTDGARWQASLYKDDKDDSILYFQINKTNFTQPINKIRIKKTWDGLMKFDGFEDSEKDKNSDPRKK